MDQAANDKAARGVEKCRRSAAALARSREEFLAMRAATPPGMARDRLDRTIQLNGEALAAVKRTAAILEADLIRQGGSATPGRGPILSVTRRIAPSTIGS